MFGDHRHQGTANDRRIGIGRHFGDVLGPRNAEAERDRQRRVGADAADHRFCTSRHPIARAGYAEREIRKGTRCRVPMPDESAPQ